jgi:hypothetical protein
MSLPALDTAASPHTRDLLSLVALDRFSQLFPFQKDQPKPKNKKKFLT